MEDERTKSVGKSLRNNSYPATNNKEWLEISHSNQCYCDAIYTDICAKRNVAYILRFLCELHSNADISSSQFNMVTNSAICCARRE